MVEFVNNFGQVITNIFDFFKNTIGTFVAIGDAVSGFFTAAAAIISVLPLGVQAIIYSALALLVGFIVIELTRDYL